MKSGQQMQLLLREKQPIEESYQRNEQLPI